MVGLRVVGVAIHFVPMGLLVEDYSNLALTVGVEEVGWPRCSPS